MRMRFIQYFSLTCISYIGLLWYSDYKKSACSAGDPGLDPWEDHLEKVMATHSSILAWEIPWTEQPGRLQSIWLQIVGHNWATNTHTHTHITHNMQRSYCSSLSWLLSNSLSYLNIELNDNHTYASVLSSQSSSHVSSHLSHNRSIC